MPLPTVSVMAMILIVSIGVLRSSEGRWRTPLAWAVAAGTSWAAAHMIGINPALAASAALLSVSQTASGSIRKAFTDTLVILSGLLVGVALLDILGPHAWVAALTAAAGWGVATIIGLSEQTALRIPAGAIALFALSEVPTANSMWSRAAALVLGAGIGLLVSAGQTPKPINTAEVNLSQTLSEIAELLNDIAGQLHSPTSVHIDEWNDRADNASRNLEEVNDYITTITGTRQWIPWRRAADTAHLHALAHTGQATLINIKTLLAALNGPSQIDTEVVADVVAAAGAALDVASDTLAEHDDIIAVAPEIHATVRQATPEADTLRNLDDTGELLLSGAIVGGLVHAVEGIGDENKHALHAAGDKVVLPWLRK